MNRRILPAVLLLGAGALLLFTPTGRVASQTIESVLVTNFPAIQKVEGEIEIKRPIPLSKLVSFEQIIVPPVRPTETTRLVEAGILTTEGFPEVVLSLHGVVKGSVLKPGSVGAILLPAQPTIVEAFNEQGLVHFAMELTASGVSSATPYFASNQPRYTIGFRTYKVLLYNTTDKTVTVDVFAYLTS